MLMALGAFHGINPGMGWLFAVALGMQERRRGAVLRALVPLGAGHALAVAAAVGLALVIGAAMPLGWLRWPLAGVLVSLGVLRLAFRRPPPQIVSLWLQSDSLQYAFNITPALNSPVDILHDPGSFLCRDPSPFAGRGVVGLRSLSLCGRRPCFSR